MLSFVDSACLLVRRPTFLLPVAPPVELVEPGPDNHWQACPLILPFVGSACLLVGGRTFLLPIVSHVELAQLGAWRTEDLVTIGKLAPLVLPFSAALCWQHLPLSNLPFLLPVFIPVKLAEFDACKQTKDLSISAKLAG